MRKKINLILKSFSGLKIVNRALKILEARYVLNTHLALTLKSFKLVQLDISLKSLCNNSGTTR